MEQKTTTKFVLLSLLSIICLVITQLIASMVYLVPIPKSFSNIIFGFTYVALAYVFIKILCNKTLKQSTDFFLLKKEKIYSQMALK